MATTYPAHQGAPRALPRQWEPFGIKGDFFHISPYRYPCRCGQWRGRWGHSGCLFCWTMTRRATSSRQEVILV